MNKKTTIAVIVILAIAGAWLVLRFIIGGDEDTWICDNGVWVEHGVPSAPKPTDLCPGGEVEQILNSPSVQLEELTPLSRITISITESGEINYEGLNTLDQEVETSSTTVTQEEYAGLVNLISSSGFYELEGEYKDESLVDGNTYTIVVTTEDEIEIVSCYGECPEGFTAIREKIEELYIGGIIDTGV
ncbi:hypothetical protein KKB10_03840 [Patescibacteria group bacterium]|nr:hypothetical protein [Patescibacteria group bacterium]